MAFVEEGILKDFTFPPPKKNRILRSRKVIARGSPYRIGFASRVTARDSDCRSAVRYFVLQDRTMRFALQRGAERTRHRYRVKGCAPVPRHVNSSPGCLEGSPWATPAGPSRRVTCTRLSSCVYRRVSPLSCARDVRRSVTMWSSMKYYSLFLYLSPCLPLCLRVCRSRPRLTLRAPRVSYIEFDWPYRGRYRIVGFT